MKLIGTFWFVEIGSADCDAPRKLADWAVRVLGARVVNVKYRHRSKLPWLYETTEGTDEAWAVAPGCEHERALAEQRNGLRKAEVLECDCGTRLLRVRTVDHVALIPFRPRPLRSKLLKRGEDLAWMFYHDFWLNRAGSRYENADKLVDRVGWLVADMQHLIDMNLVGDLQRVVMEMKYLTLRRKWSVRSIDIMERRLKMVARRLFKGRMWAYYPTWDLVVSYLDESTARHANGDAPEPLARWAERAAWAAPTRVRAQDIASTVRLLAKNGVAEKVGAGRVAYVWADPVERNRALARESL